MKTSSSVVFSQMPAWPMSLPSSIGVMIGSVAEVELVVRA